MTTLDQLQCIKQWHVHHRHNHPVEGQAWDVMLALWLMGWVGWLPAIVLGAFWAAPICLAGILIPSLYVAGRMKAHKAHWLRCDWLGALR